MEWKTLLSSERVFNVPKANGDSFFEPFEDAAKIEFEKDYQTIINSASFRRLQDKTQVFPLEKNDFIRTRLTHSLETSYIARQLGNMVLAGMANKPKNFVITARFKPYYDDYMTYQPILQAIPEILACAGLLHDIGNPPYGHFGEIVLSDWFKENLGKMKYGSQSISSLFSDRQIQDLYHLEGNAQALRVVAKLHFLDNDYGMNLTKALLNVIVKYPCTSDKIDVNSEDIRYHKLGFYSCDEMLMNTVTDTTGTHLKENIYARHPLTYLLEAADDIAYATADLEDAFKKGLIHLDTFIAYARQQFKEEDKTGKSYSLFKELESIQLNTKKIHHEGYELGNEINDLALYKMQIWLTKARKWLMYNAAYSFRYYYADIMQGRYNKELMDGEKIYHKKTLKILKDVSKIYVFGNDSINKREISGSVILSFLLEKFIHAIIYYDDPLEKNMTKEDKKLIRLLPDNYLANYKFEKEQIDQSILSDKDKNTHKLYLRFHLVIDFICGMTDSYAKSLYQELHGS